jgi:pimeloyl-ACP methyl ester carboxylesterase
MTVARRMTAAITHHDAHLPNGIRLHYAQSGDPKGRLILFVHGFPEFWAAWEQQLGEFGSDYHAVAPDLRGFNLSEQPHEVEKYRAKHVVEDIRQLIAHLGHNSCVLVAHDWGGAVMWGLAALYPQLVEKLIIINAPHPALFQRDLAHDAAQIQASAYMNLLRSPRAEALLGEDDFARLAKLVAGMSQNVEWFTPEVQERYKVCWRRGITGGLNFYRASPLHPATESEPGAVAVRLQREMLMVKVPTLVIWGLRDEALLPRQLDGLEDYVWDLRVERIEAGSHWVVHEFPERVNALIRGFI